MSWIPHLNISVFQLIRLLSQLVILDTTKRQYLTATGIQLYSTTTPSYQLFTINLSPGHITEQSSCRREKSQEKTYRSAAADLAGFFFSVVVIIQVVTVQSTLVFCCSQAPLCLAMTFRWSRGDSDIWLSLSLSETVRQPRDDLAVI